MKNILKAAGAALALAAALTLTGCGHECLAGNCDGEIYQEGYCKKHYDLAEKCAAEGCSQVAKTDGYCGHHYYILFEHSGEQ